MAEIIHIIRLQGGISSFSKDFVPKMENKIRVRLSWGLLPDDEIDQVPRTIVIGRPNYRTGIHDIFGMSSGPYLFSPRARALIDSLEPDTHKFLAVNVRTEKIFKGTHDHGDYYLLYRCPVIDCIVVEETYFKKSVEVEGQRDRVSRYIQGKAGKSWPIWAREGGVYQFPHDMDADLVVVDGNKIKDRHLWRLSEEFGREYMVSDEFYKAMKAEKMRGWETDQTCVVKF